MVDLSIINELDIDLSEFEDLYLKIAEVTAEHLNIEDELELSVTFVDLEKIHQINRDYRNVDRPTDVITFALEDEESPFIEGMPRELGDIFICLDKAKEQAVEYGHSLKREMCFLFTHGLLHLLGYDHMEEEEEKEMFDLQDIILEKMDIKREL